MGCKEYKVMLSERNEIKKFIETYHYSKSINGLSCKYCFKLLDSDGNLIGAMIYGKIAMANVYKKYVENESDIIELRRLALIDNTYRNAESYFIGKTLNWLKKNTNIKKVISYADPYYNHIGTIYKASNFKLVGKSNKGRFILYKGMKYHDKTIRTKYKGELKPFASNIKAALCSGEAKYISTPEKYIYMYEL